MIFQLLGQLPVEHSRCFANVVPNTWTSSAPKITKQNGRSRYETEPEETQPGIKGEGGSESAEGKEATAELTSWFEIHASQILTKKKALDFRIPVKVFNSIPVEAADGDIVESLTLDSLKKA